MMAACSTRRHKKAWGPSLIIGLALLVILSFTAIGCKDEKPAPRQVTKKIVVPPKQAAAPSDPEAAAPDTASEEKPAAEVVAEPREAPEFRPLSDRDPFKSFVAARAAETVTRAKTPKIRTPLQRYSLDQLKVVGIIAGGSMRKALLEDDVGKGYVVSPGDAVGSEGGIIASVQQDRIVIESSYVDVLGNKKVRRVTKKLYVSEEGENP